MIKILFLASSLNTGDLNQKDAILSALSNIEPIEIIVDASSPNAKEIFLDKAPQNEKYITIAIGDHGQNLLLELKNHIDKENNYVVLSTHQYTDKIAELTLNKIIDHIALPEATINSKARKHISKINQSLLFTVPTKNPSLDNLKHDYNNWNEPTKPSLDKKYIIVTLPGDIIDPSGKISLFSLSSAKELLKYIKKLWMDTNKEYEVIIQNSPRTGKYDHNGNIICSHQHNNNEIDHISLKFIAWLEEENIPHKFFNFTFKDGKTNSVYNQLIYLGIEGKDNYFITSAGSISMMAQIPFYIPANKNIAFKPDSMKEAHTAIFNLGIDRQYFSYFLKDGTIAKSTSSKIKTDDDAKKLANDLTKAINLK
jgi:hypothetical protein